jgi:hypothetical protein
MSSDFFKTRFESGDAGITSAGMSRARFIRISGAGIAGAALLAALGPAAIAQPDSSLEAELEEAAKQYGVPVELLLAMGYVNTRWEMPPPDTTPYKEDDPDGRGTYGIMQLVQSPFEDTLGAASKLTGISEEKLKSDRKSNILGGAALLADSQGKAKPDRLGGWSGAVGGRGGNGKDYRAVAGVGAGELYVDQISEALTKGASKQTKSGEKVSLPAKSLDARVNAQGEVS